MTTLTRSTSRTTPGYKDYVNFLEGYRSGKKDEQSENSESSILRNNFSSSNSSKSTSSSSVNSDVTDFSKNTCVPYNTFLENSRTKKFNSVKPKLEENTTKKSEIYIEIQPETSVSEVAKIFEKNTQTKKPSPSSKINSTISIFETKFPAKTNKRPPPKITLDIKRESPPSSQTHVFSPPLPQKPAELKMLSTPPLKSSPPRKPTEDIKSSPAPPTPPPMINSPKISTEESKTIPVPPPLPPLISLKKPTEVSVSPVINRVPKKVCVSQEIQAPPPPPMPTITATLNKGPQVTRSVNNPHGVVPATIDRNDPMVRKLVYGTLRGLYGAYHDKANDMMATLPKSRVKTSHGVQNIIDKIASNGDLEKLNGRINPKLEQD